MSNTLLEDIIKEDNITSLDKLKSILDELITFWRNYQKENNVLEQIDIGGCYIDAYQTIRKNVFGEILPLESKAD